MAWVTIAGMVLALVLVLTERRTYTSTASFFPQARRSASSLSGLAAQFGVNIVGGEAAQSVQFYVDLMKSRQILGVVVNSEISYPTSSGEVKAPIWKVLGVTESDTNARRDAGIRLIAPHIFAAQEVRTGVITMRVVADNPVLAKVLAERLIDEVTRFNVETRQSQAAAERRFTERRLSEVRVQLSKAEKALQDFLENNRSFGSSPQLSFERDRLTRDIAVQSALYNQLSASFESAKIEEVRDTPVLTVINAPGIPSNPDSRQAVTRLLVGGLLGLFAGMAAAVASMAVSHWRASQSPVLAQLRSYASAQGGIFGRTILWLTAS